jgi:hypothetical protein
MTDHRRPWPPCATPFDIAAVGDPVGEGRGLPDVQWRSLGPAVAEVSSGGMVRARAGGQ